MSLLRIEKILDRAVREYLLESKTLFTSVIQLTAQMRKDPAALERAIRDSGFLKVSRYRNEKEGFARVGRPVEVSFAIDDLLIRRPETSVVRDHWNEARHASLSFELNSFLVAEFALCFRKAAILPGCVRVLEHLIKNGTQNRGMYIRQIPHGESTKWIGHEPILLRLFSHYLGRLTDWDTFLSYFGLKQKAHPFQFYAPQVAIDGHSLSNFHGLITHESVLRYEFSVSRVLLIENEESFTALQGLLHDVILVLGSGRTVALADFLMSRFPSQVLYWGDIDKAGYEIFSGVRAIFKNALPICMGMETIGSYPHLRQSVAKQTPGTLPIPLLQTEYEKVCHEGIRLEQEQLPIEEILKAINRQS